MARIPIALQLYSIRDDCAKDFPGCLEAVAKMGYDGVEFAGYHGLSAKELKKICGDLGLVPVGAHVGMDTLMGDQLQATIDFHLELGSKYPVVPWIPEEYRPDADGWRRTADMFNEIAANLKPHGLKTGYHNHHIEWTPVGGEIPWDVFFSNTCADVIMQLDLGNALHGGTHAEPYIGKYPGRSTTLHLKEFSATNDQALIGEGDVRWEEAFRLAETVGGTEWYIVEQESYAFPPLECVARCLENLRKMGK